VANETTTTTMNDITLAAVIEPTFLDYAHDWVVAAPLVRQFDARGKGSAVVSIPSFASDMGTVGAHGTGVDTEFDGTEATDLSNIALDTNTVSITAAEYGVLRTITDNVFEDSIGGLDLLNRVVADCARILMTAYESDIVTLFGSFSAGVGSTTVDLTVANMIAAQVAIRQSGIRAPDGVSYVLDEQQVDDLEAALIAGNAAASVYAGATDRLMDVDKGPNNGMGNGHVMRFRGYPVYSSGLTLTANAAADVAGACFVHSSPSNDPFAAIGTSISREFRMETQRDASMRATEVVCTMRKGVAEISDASGQYVITDA
jgi:hypothetical protein